MILEWTQQIEPLSLQWVGPNKITTAVSTMEQVATKLAVITGPRGPEGPPGPEGPEGRPGETIIIAYPTVIDGGNF